MENTPVGFVTLKKMKKSNERGFLFIRHQKWLEERA